MKICNMLEESRMLLQHRHHLQSQLTILCRCENPDNSVCIFALKNENQRCEHRISTFTAPYADRPVLVNMRFTL